MRTCTPLYIYRKTKKTGVKQMPFCFLFYRACIIEHRFDPMNEIFGMN